MKRFQALLVLLGYMSLCFHVTLAADISASYAARLVDNDLHMAVAANVEQLTPHDHLRWTFIYNPPGVLHAKDKSKRKRVTVEGIVGAEMIDMSSISGPKDFVVGGLYSALLLDWQALGMESWHVVIASEHPETVPLIPQIKILLTVTRAKDGNTEELTLEYPPYKNEEQMLALTYGHGEAVFYVDSDGATLQSKIRSINAKTFKYIDDLDVNAVTSRQLYNIKGKKKLGEALVALKAMYDSEVDEHLRMLYKNTAIRICEVTKTSAYHDLALLDPQTFQQDSTSYFKVHQMMRDFGLDVSNYERELAKVKVLIDQHLPSRAVHNQMAFYFYYHALQWEYPYTFDELIKYDFQTRKHASPEHLDRQRRYYITHELMYLHAQGELDRLTKADIDYLQHAVNTWLIQYHDAQDFSSELLWTMPYVSLHHQPLYLWGLTRTIWNLGPRDCYGHIDYGSLMNHLEPYVKDLQLYLHTTQVTLVFLNEELTRTNQAMIELNDIRNMVLAKLQENEQQQQYKQEL